MSEISLLKERRSYQEDRFYKYLAPNGAKAGTRYHITEGTAQFYRVSSIHPLTQMVLTSGL